VKKALIFILFQLLLLELACFLFIKFYFFSEHRRFFYEDYEQRFDNLPMALVSRFSGYKQSIGADVKFDPDLGWDNIPMIGGRYFTCRGDPWQFSFDQYTSRKTPSVSPDDALISLYGGSYTLGAEVNDDQTWQYYLEQTSGEKVMNYGVGGFGTDQAIFKLDLNQDCKRWMVGMTGCQVHWMI